MKKETKHSPIRFNKTKSGCKFKNAVLLFAPSAASQTQILLDKNYIMCYTDLRRIRKLGGETLSVYATKQRKVLLDFLKSHADEVFSADRICESLGSEDISLSAIYRNLSALEAAGKVQRVTKGGCRRVFYRYKAADKCREHIHLSCEKCGKTFHMPLPATNRLIDNVKKNTDFEIDRTETVLYGVCGECKKK